MIDKYRLEDLRRESGEKGELARWVIQLQIDLDRARRMAYEFAPPGYGLRSHCPQCNGVRNTTCTCKGDKP